MQNPELKLNIPSPVQDAVNADFDFWNWYYNNQSKLIAPWNMIKRVATETAALYLPESLMDKHSTDAIVHGTRYVSHPAQRWQRTVSLNDTILELSADPTLALAKFPRPIFQDEISPKAQRAIYHLAQLVVHEIPSL